MAPVNGTVAGWVLTVYFYAALHFVSAYLKSKNIECQNHDERRRWIRSDHGLARIRQDYWDLQQLCWNARYGMNVYGEQEIADARGSIANIRAQIEALLPQP